MKSDPMPSESLRCERDGLLMLDHEKLSSFFKDLERGRCTGDDVGDSALFSRVRPSAGDLDMESEKP